MAEAARQHNERLSFDEWLAWASAPGNTSRSDLYAGEVFMMAPERAEHGRVKYRVTKALESAIDGAGVDCEAFVDSLAIKIDDTKGFEPDVLVNCGPPVPPDYMVATNPIIAIEIISPSSERLDLSTKFVAYTTVPSIQHYIVGFIESRYVVHYRRTEAAKFETRILRDGKLHLDPPGLVIDVATFFGGSDGTSAT